MNKQIFIAVAVITIVVVISLVKKEQVKAFFKSEATQKTIKHLCVIAEEVIKDNGKGTERLRYVVGALYEKVPESLQRFITVEMLEEAIQYVFDEISVIVNGHNVALM